MPGHLALRATDRTGEQLQIAMMEQQAVLAHRDRQDGMTAAAV
jgi:hypothetical protein